MTKCTTAVTPLLTHLSCCSLAQSHQNIPKERTFMLTYKTISTCDWKPWILSFCEQSQPPLTARLVFPWRFLEPWRWRWHIFYLLSVVTWGSQQERSLHIDGLVQERRNSIANALELRLSYTKLTNPSNFFDCLRPCPRDLIGQKMDSGWYCEKVLMLSFT